MHIHILGICGTFMGGLAAIAREAGHRVTGCDSNVYPPMSEQLGSLGIGLTEGYGAEQLALAPDLWVVGNVVTRGNPLMEAILDERLPYTSGPQWLLENVLGERWVLAVAGTHGKTTTASLLAYLLESAGLAPGFLIGGIAADFGVSARLGGGRFFVVEADEYDTAFFDKRSKFVHYRPMSAVLNNLEFDHADIFPDLAAIETQFHHLVRTIPRSGRIIWNATDPALARVLGRGAWSELEGFLDPDGWSIGPVSETSESCSFDILESGQVVAHCRLPLSGAHNRANALAAIAAAAHVGVAPRDSAAALAGFKGVRRRMELRGTVAGVEVYDDFAHHPSAILTTIAGLRERIGEQGRILAVLEPRSNTMKLGVMRSRLPASLAEADLVFCHSGGLDWDATEALAPIAAKTVVRAGIEPLVDEIVAAARPGDRILVMSNGGFGGIHARLLGALDARC